MSATSQSVLTALLAALTLVWGSLSAATAQEKTAVPSSKPDEVTARLRGPTSAPDSQPDGGMVKGLLMAKGDNWISIKAAGQQAAARYSAKDPAVIAAISKLTIPSQVQVAWKADGGRTVIRIETAQAVATSGEVQGVVTAKGKNGAMDWIEVKPADGPADRYYILPGHKPDMAPVISATNVGATVKVTWQYQERKRVFNLEPMAAP